MPASLCLDGLSSRAALLLQGFANPLLDTKGVQTIVVVMASAVEAAIAHVGSQHLLIGHT